MKSRRQFVKQGALATTALLAASPFKAFAGTGLSFAGGSADHIVFLHTAENSFSILSHTAEYIKDIKNKEPDTMLIHSGRERSSAFRFDAQAPDEGDNEVYTIYTRNRIKTGMIFIGPGEQDPAEKASRLATMLKTEKGCQLVVCISHLGFSNTSGADDISLAKSSRNLDLIIGGNMANYTEKTYVLRNQDKHEVIIQSSKNSVHNCAKIEFSFDKSGAKRHVHVARKLYKHSVTA